MKLLCQPAVIAARLPEVIRQHPAVVDEDDGQEYVVLYVQPQMLRRDRLEGTAGQHRQPAVRLQHGVLYVAQVGDPLTPQLFEQLVQGQPVAAHGLLPQLAVHDHQGRLAADQVPEAYVPQADGAEQCGQGDQRDDGNDAVEQRQGKVLHGYGGQVGDQQRQHQLDGLQFADLPLAAEAQARDQQQIENDRAEKGSRRGGANYVGIQRQSRFVYSSQNGKEDLGTGRHKRQRSYSRRMFPAGLSLLFLKAAANMRRRGGE